jgi:hypothetical protein
VDLARSGLTRAPLAFEPFFIVAKSEEQAGRKDRALLLMEEVRRRRPNHVSSRAQLAVYYGQTGDYDGFINEMDYVLGRSEGAQRPLLPELVKVIAIPAGREALAKLLAREPRWREGFFRVAADRNVNPEHAAALVALIRIQKRDGDLAPEQLFYMQTLVTAGQYGRAKTVWAQSFAKGQAGDDFVVDGDFRGFAGPPPFNWVFQDSEIGRATVVSPTEGQPGLDVEYFGGSSTVLADQMLALRPGRHRLAFSSSEGEGGENGGRIFWRVICLPDSRELVRMALELPMQGSRAYEGSFVVPAGSCSGQRLQLVAEPGDVAASMRLRVSKLSIRQHG